MLHYFFSKWKNVNYTTKIMLVNIFIIVVIFLSAGILIYRNVYSKLYETEEFLATKSFDDVTEYFTNIQNMVFEQYTSMHRHGDLAETFKNIRDHELDPFSSNVIKMTNNYFSILMAANPIISDVILIGPEGAIFSQSREQNRMVSQSYPFDSYCLIQQAQSTDYNILVELDQELPYLSQKCAPVISYIGKLYDLTQVTEKNVVGYFIINIPVDHISKQFHQHTQNLISDINYVNSENVILFSTKGENIGQEFSENHTSGIIDSQIIDITGSRTILQFDTGRPIRYANEIRQYLVIMLLVGSALLICSTYLFHQNFLVKLNKIVTAMDTAQNESFTRRLPVKGTDEVGRLSASFNRMCDHLQRYIELNYTAETQKRLAIINALQAQINPHFLYNTIDSIREKALSNDVSKQEQVPDMLLMLAQLFRYSADFNESFVYLEDEISYVESYLELQQQRFGDSFEYEISLPYELSYMGVPKLILQPIVENAIVHGLRNKKHRIIQISIHLDGANLVIQVSDNGCGMPPEQVTQLNTLLQSNEKSPDFSMGIGIKNVHDRINLLFGESAGIFVSSTEGIGTNVRILMPAIEREDID